MLLGAGVSAGAEVKTAWEVQQELLSQLALAGDVTPADPFAWFEEKYGYAPTYERLLGALAPTQQERQALLRPFFEPDEEERVAGLKLPTAAHQAAARLAASGWIRVFITTNFDRLMETALRAEGVEPVVVTSPYDVSGLAPLHAISCLVVHLHGDYLTPSSMLNTVDELNSYPEEVDGLLDRVFDEYGLIVAGWSAVHDTALRAAWSRCSARRFSSFWVDPYPLAQVAADLLHRRGATFVQDTAERFLGQVADAVEAIVHTEQRHPATVEIAVATAKRALSGAHTAIGLHDTLRAELNRLHECPTLRPDSWDSANVSAERSSRLARLEAAAEIPLALVATTAYWGSAETDQWWLGEIERFATTPRVHGATELIQLVKAPATMLIHAAGVAALGAERYDLVGQLLTRPMTTDLFTG
jgi:hypothetical protein